MPPKKGPSGEAKKPQVDKTFGLKVGAYPVSHR